MSRGPEQRIIDILSSISRCQQYSARLLGSDPLLVNMAEDAIERNLQIIGEAVNHLPPNIINLHPEIPWPQIRGFRNILVHQYFGVDAVIVQEVIQVYLPPLADALLIHIDTSKVRHFGSTTDSK